MDKTRIAVVGAGRISQAYAAALKACEHAQPVVVVDPRREAASALGEQLGCSSAASVGAALDGNECDAILVLTPPATHSEICLKAINSNVHVLCEKPLSVDAVSGYRMVAAAERAGVILCMASKFRFVEDVIQAKALLASGALGELVLLENTFASWVDMSDRWNSDPRVGGGGVLIDNGTHSVDLARLFLGPIRAVKALKATNIQNLPVEDTVKVFLRGSGDALGSVDLSWSINKGSNCYFALFGSHGSVRLGWRGSEYRREGDSRWSPFGTGYDKVEAFRRQIENFSLAVQGEGQLLLSAADALASVDVISSAYQSLEHEEWVAVNGRSVSSLSVDSQGPGLRPAS